MIDDEPHEGTDVGPLIAWGRAIHAAEPKVLIWEDPTYKDPAKAPSGLFEGCQILCPNRPMWLTGDDKFARFYLDEQRCGRTLQLYSCSGPARLLDPYSYYRLEPGIAGRSEPPVRGSGRSATMPAAVLGTSIRPSRDHTRHCSSTITRSWPANKWKPFAKALKITSISSCSAKRSHGPRPRAGPDRKSAEPKHS